MSQDPAAINSEASEQSGSAESVNQPIAQKSPLMLEIEKSGILDSFKITPASAPQADPKGQPAVAEAKTEIPEEPATVEAPELKELENLKSVLGRQGNELGELRKQNEELLAKISAAPTPVAKVPTQEETVDQVLKATDDEIAESLRRSYAKNGVELSAEELRAKVAEVRLSAVTKKTTLLAQTIEQQAAASRQAELIKQKDALFVKEHPELDARKERMNTLFVQMFPGINSVGELAAQGQDPWVIGHMLYQAAGLIPAAAAQAVIRETEKQKAATLKSQTSVSSAPAASKKPLTPLQKALGQTMPDIFTAYKKG